MFVVRFVRGPANKFQISGINIITYVNHQIHNE
jgi:hypothetical protein